MNGGLAHAGVNPALRPMPISTPPHPTGHPGSRRRRFPASAGETRRLCK